MKSLTTRLLFAAMFVGFAADTPADEEEKPFGLKARVPWTTSKVVGTPDPPAPYTVKRVFPNLKFDGPVFIAQEPGTERLVVGEHSGKLFAFDGSDRETDARELFLDIGRQLYAFSFHPNYEENGVVFTFSPTDPKDKSEEKQSRVSRFTAGREHPRTCSAETEEVIIEWLAGGHNGGEAIIGPDGYLYIGTGDSTSGSDPKETGQGVDDLFSVIMRIDVDHPDGDKLYSVPKDNPFVNYPGARPEIWAFGFRNPWRMSFDSKTGDLWVGDVGQDLWEMIWQVQRGGNYGWSVQEGGYPFHPNQELGPGPILPPVIEHHHTECRSITGGYVYRGEKFPELEGVYVYGDYEYGKIWGVKYDGDKVTWQKELANTALRIPTFGVSRDGDIYLFDYTSGELYELATAPEATANAKFPRRLSESGIFTSVKDHEVAPGVMPYSVNVPQWCDNAVKQRFVAVPEMSTINFVEQSGNASTWGFDDGTVTIETLSLEMEAGNAESLKRIETRIIVKQQNHWLGYSYLWNDAQTDAALVDARGQDLVFSIADAAAAGGKRQQTWRIPSRNECMVCHSRAAAFVLGLRTEQMNKDHDYGGVIDNQLRAMNHIGLFTKPIEKAPSEYDAHSDLHDSAADLSERARAYLHVNCSVCHVSDGGGNAKMQMTYHQKLAETKLIDEKPIHGTFGLADGRIIAPGDPYASVLLYRLSKRGRGRMPHVGSNVTDERGLELIHDWIANLPDEKEAPPRPLVKDEVAAALETLGQAKESSAEQRLEAYHEFLSSTRTAFIASRLVAQEPSLESIREELIATATQHTDPNIRDLYERFLPEEQRAKRLGDIVNPTEILKLDGDAESGRRFFLTAAGAQCRNCHRVQETGGTLGPDLSGVGKKYKPHELLETLIEPSKKIDPKYLTHVLITTEGKILTGILVEKTEKEVVLNVLKNGKGELTRVATEHVEELLPQTKSLMPDRMLRDLTAQQAADLLAFLLSLKQDNKKP
jgi:uncharacterized repeat protein (TIGR03806 family)